MEKSKKRNSHPTQEIMNDLENLFKLNKLDLLEKKINELINIYSNSSVLLNILGILNQKKNDLNSAIINFKLAIKIDPNFKLAINNLGNAFKNIGELEESVLNYKKAIKLDPYYAEAHSNLGVVHKELGQLHESVDCLEKAIKLKPDYFEAYSNLGNALSELGKFEKAVENHKKAIKINPNYAEAYSNLGNALGELGKFGESINSHKKALDVNPKYLHSIFNESVIRLILGEFETGWKQYEYRFTRSGIGLSRYAVERLWNGKYLNGTLLVWGEQGVGDHILFASMLTDLKKYAKDIILEIDTRLVNLFERYFEKINFSNIKVLSLEKKILTNFDKHVAIGSLGQYLRKTRKSFNSTPKKYLISSSKKEEDLKNKFFKNNKINIGISWKTLNKKQQFRNIDLEEMLPILLNSNCNFVNLQFGKSDSDIERIKLKYNINIQTISDIDNYNDIDGLASLINCLDLIITIQNSTAHLSAALGKKTWIMLLKNARWHWTLTDMTKSLWYPSAKLFRQDKFSDWKSVVKSINMNLDKFQLEYKSK